MPHIRTIETATQKREAKYRGWDDDELGEVAAPDEEQGQRGAGPAADCAYRDLIQRDGAVCDTCFTRRYDVLTYEWWRGSFGWLDYEQWTALSGRSVPVPSDEGHAAAGNRLACADCGMSAGKSRPIPKAKLRRYVGNLSDTLRAKEIDHCPEALHREVRRRNTSENQMRQDSHVFEPAVALAIRAENRTLPLSTREPGSDPAGQTRPRAQDVDLVERGGRRQAADPRRGD